MKRLFADIETSPNIGYFWKSSYKANIPHGNILFERAIICISYKWEGKEVKNLSWKRGDDKELLEKFIPILNKADEVVGHNWNKYDMKFIKGRCFIHDIPTLETYSSFDTLTAARGVNGFNLNSNRLDYIDKVLGGEGKIKTSFDLWHQITSPIVTGNWKGKEYKEALKYMIEYCNEDVEVLERVFNRIKKYVPIKTNASLVSGDYKWNCPSCASGNIKANGTFATAKTRQRRMICKNCGKSYKISEALYREYNTFLLDIKEANRKLS